MLPYGRQSISQSDIDAVAEVLRSEWLTQGPGVGKFERLAADYCGVKYAVAVGNGTAALHLSALALGLKEGDWLWTSPVTFVATANCARYCGAGVDFVDINPRTGNMDVGRLESKLKKAAAAGRLPKVVAPVHLAGQSCEMEAIGALAGQYGFAVLEDAAHALGGSYQGKPVGGCRHSDLAIFSFHPVKIITTAEGGMVMTNRKDLRDKLALLRAHGITRDADQMTGPSHGPWYYQQVDLGFNYRLTDLQAALGASQMRRLDEFVARRRFLAGRYHELLRELPLQLPWQHPGAASSWHLYIVRLQLDRIGRTHREVFEAMRAAGIGVNLHYIPVHLQPYYQKLGFKQGDFPEAERYYGEAMSLPLFYDLGLAEQDRVAAALKTAVGQ
jgi:UDP-4-amino-4,6-dideoxy-N-acetyl-beta-L-altrosamine transaminase